MEKVNKWGEILARKNSNASCLRKAWPHIIGEIYIAFLDIVLSKYYFSEFSSH